jgi:hypothetical protein
MYSYYKILKHLKYITKLKYSASYSIYEHISKIVVDEFDVDCNNDKRFILPIEDEDEFNGNFTKRNLMNLIHSKLKHKEIIFAIHQIMMLKPIGFVGYQ